LNALLLVAGYVYSAMAVMPFDAQLIEAAKVVRSPLIDPSPAT
jgi:hypothetical protein